MSSIYTINKGINKPLEFKGLRAQYIAYLGMGLVGLLLLFAILYLSGFPVWVCLPVVGGLGAFLFTTVYKYSHKYGQYGLLKEAAHRAVPAAIICRTRIAFKTIAGTHNKPEK